jgi:DNA repair protein RadA/Sms
VVFGEVGLAGELRGINSMETRIREAARMGFRRAVVPKIKDAKTAKVGGGDIRIVPLRSLRELPEHLF